MASKAKRTMTKIKLRDKTDATLWCDSVDFKGRWRRSLNSTKRRQNHFGLGSMKTRWHLALTDVSGGVSDLHRWKSFLTSADMSSLRFRMGGKRGISLSSRKVFFFFFFFCLVLSLPIGMIPLKSLRSFWRQHHQISHSSSFL